MQWIVELLNFDGTCYSSVHGPFESKQKARNFAKAMEDLDVNEIIHDYEIFPLNFTSLINPDKLKFLQGSKSK